jgi:hypothetical protein
VNNPVLCNDLADSIQALAQVTNMIVPIEITNNLYTVPILSVPALKLQNRQHNLIFGDCYV